MNGTNFLSYRGPWICLFPTSQQAGGRDEAAVADSAEPLISPCAIQSQPSIIRSSHHCWFGLVWTSMAVQTQASETRHIAFVLIPNYSMIAFASALEPLRIANLISERPLYSWSFHSIDGEPVSASNGLTTQPDGSVETIRNAEMVVVCAGVNVERQVYPNAFLSSLRYLASHGVTIGAICTGTYVLAKAGLLNDHRCTIHWENLRGFSEEFPDIEITSELFEFDRRRITSAGGTASLDMMLHYVSIQNGITLASSVADMMMHHPIRRGDDPQRPYVHVRLGVTNPKLLAAITIMEADIETPMSCSDLAAAVGLSTRQLERLFAKQLSTTPMRYYMWIRLIQARRLLTQTSMSILRVALDCGFVSASHFSKCYREQFGKTPTQERLG
jgi:transcriptional regulator GlxA family with amidase domain